MAAKYTQILEIDRNFRNSDDEVSDNASNPGSDTTSLFSVARNHAFENGRRYHGYKEGKYCLPNDEAERDRMSLIHHCCLLAFHGELLLSPVGKDWKPQRILDVGTGSGIWAVDMADKYSSAEVIGIDLSPIQSRWIPPNVTFEVDDVEDTWYYQDNSFDFIHLRNMAGFIYDWPKLYRQAFKALKPGGWIEVHDFGDINSTDDGSLPPTAPLSNWIRTWETASVISGRQWSTAATGAKKALKEVGCVDVSEQVIKLPIGRWPKEKHAKDIGNLWRQIVIDGTEALTLALFTRALGWDKNKVDDFLPGVCADLKNPNYHVYSNLYCTFARKPE
ncbi:hypothetical protein RUND412_003357 [Rhizina undulata]